MISLRAKDKQAILGLAEEVLPNNAQLIAYGSRVNGTAHDTSDLDLAIQTPKDNPLDINCLVEFKEALQDSNVPILVDVFDWHRVPQSFRDNIVSQPHEVLWKGAAE